MRTATGKAMRIVPRLPNSCNKSAGPAFKTAARLGPIEAPIFAINSITLIPMYGEAVSMVSRSISLNTASKAPNTRA